MKDLFRENFIGVEELSSIASELGIGNIDSVAESIPEIRFSNYSLEHCMNDYILILGIPYYKDNSELTLMKMRNHFGIDPKVSEPCFYNQDWYVKEKFALEPTIEKRWYLIKKTVVEELRGCDPFEVMKTNIILPSALVCAYTFFAYYLINKSILWENDYVWCNDTDFSGDQIYIGKYRDYKQEKRNGFEIHRFLSIKKNYSFVIQRSEAL